MTDPDRYRSWWIKTHTGMEHLIVRGYILGRKVIVETACGREYPVVTQGDGEGSCQPKPKKSCKGCLSSHWAKEQGIA